MLMPRSKPFAFSAAVTLISRFAAAAGQSVTETDGVMDFRYLTEKRQSSILLLFTTVNLS